MQPLALFVLLTLFQTQPEIKDPFTSAIVAGDVRAVTEALTHNSNWKSKTQEGTPALILAAESGQDAIIRVLLTDLKNKSDYALGAPLTDKRHRTALVAAAANGHRSTVLALLTIAEEGFRTAVAPVVRRPANDPQFEPAQNAVTNLLSAMESRSIQLNTPDEDAMTPLMIAAQHGWQDVVDSMLNNGANVHLQDKNGLTAVTHAERAGFNNVAASLRLAEQKH